MRELKVEELKYLNEIEDSGPKVSLYLSKNNGLLDTKEFSDRLKEQLLSVEFYLLKDYSRSFVNNFMEKLWLLDVAALFDSLDKGVAIFYSENEWYYIRLQTPINDLSIVADSFHIKPLIRIRNNQKGFFVVTMTSRAINVLIETEGHLLRLESYRNDPGLNGTNKKDNHDFFLQAAHELNKLFSAYALPIVLAGVKDHVGHMRKHLDKKMLLNEAIFGNVEKMKSKELVERVNELLVPYYQMIEFGALKELEVARGRELVITNLEDIAVSAVYGKIKKLFVVENRYIWGSVNQETGEIFVSPNQCNAHDDDILDDLCQMVLTRGGEVVVIKDINDFERNYAAAIVTDRTHLYDSVYYSAIV